MWAQLVLLIRPKEIRLFLDPMNINGTEKEID